MSCYQKQGHAPDAYVIYITYCVLAMLLLHPVPCRRTPPCFACLLTLAAARRYVVGRRLVLSSIQGRQRINIIFASELAGGACPCARPFIYSHGTILFAACIRSAVAISHIQALQCLLRSVYYILVVLHALNFRLQYTTTLPQTAGVGRSMAGRGGDGSDRSGRCGGARNAKIHHQWI